MVLDTLSDVLAQLHLFGCAVAGDLDWTATLCETPDLVASQHADRTEADLDTVRLNGEQPPARFALPALVRLNGR